MSQESHKNKLDLDKQKILSLSIYDWFLKSFKEKLSSKEKFYCLLTGKKISDKEYDHVNASNKFEMKTMKDYHDLYLKHDALSLADVFEKFRIA